MRGLKEIAIVLINSLFLLRNLLINTTIFLNDIGTLKSKIFLSKYLNSSTTQFATKISYWYGKNYDSNCYFTIIIIIIPNSIITTITNKIITLYLPLSRSITTITSFACIANGKLTKLHRIVVLMIVASEDANHFITFVESSHQTSVYSLTLDKLAFVSNTIKVLHIKYNQTSQYLIYVVMNNL